MAYSHNPQWGRFYESAGEDLEEINSFTSYYVEFLQRLDGMSNDGVLASVKHFLGDGAYSISY